MQKKTRILIVKMTFSSFDLHSVVVVVIFYFDPMVLRTMTKKAKTNKYNEKGLTWMTLCRVERFIYHNIQQCARILI